MASQIECENGTNNEIIDDAGVNLDDKQNDDFNSKVKFSK
jgi:hypothetical protein